jgi:preprotein translocase subunit YajC
MFNNTMLTAAAEQAQNPIAAFIPLILIFGIFYFLLIRPQQKRQKKQAEMINALKVGDEIVTTGGIYGKIERVIDTNTFIVEIADGVKIKMSKGGVAGMATKPASEEN